MGVNIYGVLAVCRHNAQGLFTVQLTSVTI